MSVALIPVAYNLETAAALTGLAITKLKSRVREGVLVARYEGKDLLFERAELERYIQSLPQERGA